MKFRAQCDNFDDNDQYGLKCEDDSLAQQHQAEESDINNIVARFLRTGELPASKVMPEFGDFHGISSMHQAVQMVRDAEEAFDRLPPALRARFSGDAAQFVAFCEDPANLPELRKLGLAKPEAVGGVIPPQVGDPVLQVAPKAP